MLAVRVNNSNQPNSRWYSGSGIYRHVWLTLTDPLHIAPSGTYVTTPEITDAQATVVVETRIENDHSGARQGTLRTTVVNAQGQQVARVETPFAAASGAEQVVSQSLRVASPSRWSLESPAMYTLHSEVVQNGEVSV